MRIFVLVIAIFFPTLVFAQQVEIKLEGNNRFRFFTHERDFKKHEDAFKKHGGNLLKMEKDMADDNVTSPETSGWASKMLSRVCFNQLGKLAINNSRCERDGIIENYLTPLNLSVDLSLKLDNTLIKGSCSYEFLWLNKTDNKKRTSKANLSCEKGIVRLPPNVDIQTIVKYVDNSGVGKEHKQILKFKNILIVGMGDSIASGEGNPDQPTKIIDQPFCFGRYFNGGNFIAPAHRGLDSNFITNCSLSNDKSVLDQLKDFEKGKAGWLYPACHRSLYGYQMRTSLQIALSQPDVFVTYIPLGCSGGTIETMFAGQTWREYDSTFTFKWEEGQFSKLYSYIKDASQTKQWIKPDLILLTIGANDIGFSKLVANVFIKEGEPERKLPNLIISPNESKKLLHSELPHNFVKLRKELAKIMGGDLNKVVYTSYFDALSQKNGQICETTNKGFSFHPALEANKEKMLETRQYLDASDGFFKQIEILATCKSANCKGQSSKYTMNFVDGHIEKFQGHGICAGKDEIYTAANNFRSYKHRERYIRNINDSYLGASTLANLKGRSFTKNALVLPPINDAQWGLTTMFYGGAIHPTAEGHALIATHTFEKVKEVLKLKP